MRKALVTPGKWDVPETTRNLASMWWPLVITTNYDNLFARAHHDAHGRSERKHDLRQPLVLGRSPLDCFRVARSLREPTPPVLWAIQGYVDAPCDLTFEPTGSLAAELVVGHEEYRRVTFREAHFRRTFAEVLRTRSFLFLGSGLAEHYILDLLSEVQEIYGPGGHLHYAICASGTVDVDFLLREFQIAVLEYPLNTEAGQDEHSAFAEIMRELPGVLRMDTLQRKTLRAGISVNRWEMEVNGLDGTSGTLVVEKSPFPALGKGGKLRKCHASRTVLTFRRRKNSTARTLASIYWETRNGLILAVARNQLDVVGKLPNTRKGYKGPYQAVHALSEMAAAFGDVMRSTPSAKGLRFIVHVQEPGVNAELRYGRLRLDEIVGCLDLRIWVSIEPQNAAPTYHLVHIPADEFSRRTSRRMLPRVNIKDVAQMFQVPEDWRVEVWPSPQKPPTKDRVRDLADAPVIYSAVTGSTVRFIAQNAPRDALAPLAK